MKHSRYAGMGLLIVLMAVGFAARSGFAQAQEAEFTRRGMLENIAYNIILPLHEDFLEQTAVLQAVTDAFVGSPAAETLLALQQAWRDTSLLWQQVGVFKLGRLTFVYHSRMDNDAPIAEAIIDTFINGTDTLNEPTVSNFGSNVIGLRTVEYLIFDENGNSEAILSLYTQDSFHERRMQYLSLTVNLLHETAQEILEIWSPDGQNYVQEFVSGDDPNSVQGSISMLTNQLIRALEDYVTTQLGWPLGSVSGTIQPDLVEARRSGATIPQILSYFETLRQTFNGTSEDGNQLGLDDYLNDLGILYNDVPLSEVINAQIDTVVNLLSEIEEPLHVALVNHPEQVQLVYDEARMLVVLMKADMVSQMGITITFVDMDGD